MISFLILFFLTSSSFAQIESHGLNGSNGSNGVGNGGDVVYCRASNDNILNGAYSLDYLLTLVDGNADPQLVSVKSWEESANRLQRLFVNKIPSLASYFQEFRETAFNADYTKARVWEPAPFGLIDLKDEFIESLVPENCLIDGNLMVVQAAIRQYPEAPGSAEKIVYKYVPKVIDELRAKSPAQLSFLLVHEWLWDVSGNVERNRKINRFFHSLQIEQMSQAEIEAQLKGMGLHLPRVEPDNFSAASCQGRRLTRAAVEENLKANSKRYYELLGKTGFEVRRRAALCDRKYPDCSRAWRKDNTLRDVTENPLYSAISMTRDFGGTVSIDLPTDMGPNRNPGYAQLKCKFVEKADTNLECFIQNREWYRGLLGISPEDWHRKYNIPPAILGLATEECVRIQSAYTEEVFGSSPQGTVRELHELQAVFTSRFRWR